MHYQRERLKPRLHNIIKKEQAMVLNRYPWWKNLLIALVVVIAFFYAAPNLFGDDPAVQISSATPTVTIDQNTINTVTKALDTAGIHYNQLQHDNHSLLLRFSSTDVQLKAKELIQATLGNDYLVALNLAAATPEWLKAMNAL